MTVPGYPRPTLFASRLCERALNSDILVGERTRKLVGGYALEPRATIQPKGFREPVSVYALIDGYVAPPTQETLSTAPPDAAVP